MVIMEIMSSFIFFNDENILYALLLIIDVIWNENKINIYNFVAVKIV